MSLTKEDISNLIQHTDKAEAFDSVMRRNIPYEPYQLAMMFMNGRRIGKSFMSYGLVAERCLELLKEFSYINICLDHTEVRGVNIKSILIVGSWDRDIEGQQRFADWINRFKHFLMEYYPELRVDRKVGYYTVTKVEGFVGGIETSSQEDVETERDINPAQDFFKDFRLSRGV